VIARLRFVVEPSSRLAAESDSYFSGPHFVRAPLTKSSAVLLRSDVSLQKRILTNAQRMSSPKPAQLRVRKS
jgi:hypothetical protein